MKPTPKYIKHIVNCANQQLARDRVQEIDNQLYQFIHSYLTDKNIGHTYGYFHYITGGKTELIVDLFNTPDQETFIQIVL